MRKFTASLALGAIALGGGTAIAVPALAQEDPAIEIQVEETRGGILGLLSELVAEGVLTQEQADTVGERIQDVRGDGFGRHKGHHKGHGRHGASLETVAEVIGVSEADLREALINGESVADVAEANDVDVQTVIDALTADKNEQIDEKLAAGEITEAEAEEMKADIAEKVESKVNGERPNRGDVDDAEEEGTA